MGALIRYSAANHRAFSRHRCGLEAAPSIQRMAMPSRPGCWPTHGSDRGTALIVGIVPRCDDGCVGLAGTSPRRERGCRRDHRGNAHRKMGEPPRQGNLRTPPPTDETPRFRRSSGRSCRLSPCRLPYAPQGHRQSLQAPACTGAPGWRAAGRGLEPVGHGVVMITCGKRANSALTAHDHGSAVERAPALRSRDERVHGELGGRHLPEVQRQRPRSRTQNSMS